jgi:hypothetical protein
MFLAERRRTGFIGTTQTASNFMTRNRLFAERAGTEEKVFDGAKHLIRVGVMSSIRKLENSSCSLALRFHFAKAPVLGFIWRPQKPGRSEM